jgi:hypothetical protein
MPEGERADMKKPRLLRVAVVLSPVILAVLAFGVLWLLGEPWVFSTNGEMDINSGDMRARACLFGVPIKSRIHESSLSEEIRRLGIAIPATRVWRRTGQNCVVQRTIVDSKYCRVLVSCEQLLSMLDQVNAPDEERRMVLERFMTSLRTEDAIGAWWQTHLLMDEVAGKRGLEVFSPEHEKTLKKMRDERGTQ